MPIENIIKNIRNIMRQDAGVSGDGQRIEQLAWMLFLKIFDDQEKYYEMRDDNFRSPIPENLRWRNWADDPEGMTGDELLDFINNKLFPGLKNLSAKTENGRGQIVREVFEDANNYMKSGVGIRQVINEINQIDFNKQDDRHLLNDIYEQILKSLQSAGDYGEFYTPRPITRFIVEMIDPKLKETVFDPACGTGGFLVNTLEYVRGNYVKTKKQEETLQEAIYGTELKPLPYILSVTNMMLHGVESPHNIRRDNTLAKSLTSYTPKDKVDVIVTNPPFGASVQEGIEQNFPSDMRTKETADLFLILFIHLLKPKGRAGVVLPDGSLFGEGVKTKIKQKLLEECNLHTIVRLPPGVFNPYAGVNTNLLFFEKGEPTQEVWYYQLPLPEGMKQYTKTRGITYEEFEPVKKWWNKRDNGDPNAWKVTIDRIKERNFNLDFKNPNGGEDKKQKDPKEIIKSIEDNEGQIISLITEIKKEL
jgi:type I restriction enzyme M protein